MTIYLEECNSLRTMPAMLLFLLFSVVVWEFSKVVCRQIIFCFHIALPQIHTRIQSKAALSQRMRIYISQWDMSHHQSKSVHTSPALLIESAQFLDLSGPINSIPIVAFNLPKIQLANILKSNYKPVWYHFN